MLKLGRFRWLWFLPIGIAFSLVNIAIVPMTDGISGQDDEIAAILIFLGIGVLMSEAGILAIWCVLGPSNVWKRLTLSFFVGIVLFTLWATGFIAIAAYDGYTGWDQIQEQLLVIVLCLPLFYLAVQTPIWPVRFWFKWRVEWSDAADDQSQTREASIRGMMIATMIVALAFGSARISIFVMDSSSADFWAAFAIMLVFASGISGISTIPATVIILRPRYHITAYCGAICYAVFALVVTLLIMAVVHVINSWSFRRFTFMANAFMIVGISVGLMPPLFLARALGLRLRWGKPPADQSSGAITST